LPDEVDEIRSTDDGTHSGRRLVMAGQSVAGARVLVTGGAGTIGSALTDQLIDHDVAQVLVLDKMVRGRPANLARALGTGRVSLVEGDIREPSVLGDLMAGTDILFHLAALRVTQCADEPRLALEVMVDGTFNVFEAAVAANVGKVVAASSASVYGAAEVFPTREDHHPWGDRTVYGAAKAFSEGLLRSFHAMYGLDYVALRFFNVYGPRMDIHGRYTEVLVRWIERIAAGEAPLIFGDGSQTMDFVFVDDVARACISAAEADVTDDVFNVAGGIEISMLDLAYALLDVMGSDLEPEFREQRTVNSVPRWQADTERAAQYLGFRADVDLRSGLKMLVAWWLEQQEQPA
jgi:UDP-glucose 4-epimerase